MSLEKHIKEKQALKHRETFSKDDRETIDAYEQKATEEKLKILGRIRERLIEKYSIDDVNNHLKFETIAKDAWLMVEEESDNSRANILIDSHDMAELREIIIQSMFGYGILDPLIKDNEITEIMVNGTRKIFVEKNGEIERARNKRGELLKFNSNDEIMYVIEKIVAPINRKVDESNPIVDARLPNGFRVNVVLNNISLDGTIITIRKFPDNPYSMNRLVEFGSLSKNVALFLEKIVKARYNLIISGGTGSGKTTFLNALSNFIGPKERIITIEDAAELKINDIDNLIRLETRPPNIEGKGSITARDLVRSALRMRPDRIVVGEVRGQEALDMLAAMNTGHDGFLSTGHANSAFDMLARLETMVLMAGMEMPLLSIRQQIASAVDIIIQVSKLRDGTRRVVEITEILKATNEGYEVSNLFKFENDYRDGKDLGRLKFTGNKIQRDHKMLSMGIVPDDIFNLMKESL